LFAKPKMTAVFCVSLIVSPARHSTLATRRFF